MPRAGLTPARVVAEAAALADSGGLDALTLAALADRLGVRVPSLYKHVDGLPAVRRRLALDGLAELHAALVTAIRDTSPGREALTATAVAYRGFARSSPGRYTAAQKAPDPDDTEWVVAGDAVTAVVLDLLAGYAIPAHLRIHSSRALRAALHGFVDLERAGGFGLPDDVEVSYRRLIAVLDVGLLSFNEAAS